MKDDYIELTNPDEVIREGDEFKTAQGDYWPCVGSVGHTVADFKGLWKFFRPRATVIRDAAEALLRAIEYRLDGSKPIIEPELSRLRIALGLTVEELRGEG